MREELEDKLFKKYPKIFIRDETIDRNLMGFGFECGDGWYWLIDKLCSSLQFQADQNGHQQMVATQVKAKFGGLCFYVQSNDEYLDAYIEFAESLSTSVCEECGSTNDVIQTKGWIRTVCKDCLDKKNNDG